MQFRTRFLMALAVLAVLALTAGGALAQDMTMVKKVDNFTFFVDQSGSMNMTAKKEKKIVHAQMLLQRMAGMIPELGYNGGLHMFAPFAEKYSFTPYDWTKMGEAIGSIDTGSDKIFGKQTPMGPGLEYLEGGLDMLSGKRAVILVSDGGHNRGIDPVKQATAMYEKFGGDLCFHVIGVYPDGEGEKYLKAIDEISDCSSMVTVADLKDDKDLQKWVENVFYAWEKDGAPVVTPPVVTPPVTKAEDPCAEVISLRSVHFDFDKSAIKAEFQPILDEAAAIMKSKPCSFILEGHTCNIGTDAYNMDLSQRRATSVRDYLISKGVSAGSLSLEWFGESKPKYDNTTREGRSLNRRVEIRMQ